MTVFRGDDLFSYALFYPYGTGKIYRRSYSNGGVSSWVEVTNYATASTMAKSIVEYTVNKWTEATVYNDGDTLFGVGGLMRVFRGVADDFSFALFYPLNSDSVYKRRWSASGWTNWVKISAV